MYCSNLNFVCVTKALIFLSCLSLRPSICQSNHSDMTHMHTHLWSVPDKIRVGNCGQTFHFGSLPKMGTHLSKMITAVCDIINHHTHFWRSLRASLL